LKPETSRSNSLGALWTPRGRVRIEVQLFSHRMEDLIQSTYTGKEGTASVYRYLNVASARIRGGLISAETSPRRGLSIGGSYQYLATRDETARAPLEYSPRQRAAARLGYTYRPWGLLVGVYANATGRAYYSAGTYMRGFEQLGVNVQKDLTRHVTLRATWRNLSNDVDPTYRITTPRAIDGSVRIHWGGNR
jgi:outer membrane receptor for ferrienterochelin and colicins